MLVGRERELAQLGSRLERGETVALLGEAGVGKTALLREGVARSGRRLYEGGGLATLSWLPYLPVERALGRKLPGGDAAWVATEVEREIGAGVLVLDDLQWVDEETRGLLPLLHGRIALLTAVRSGDPGSGPALAALASLGIEPYELEPLDEEASAALLDGLRPALSRTMVAKLIRRAGGNPLLLEELAATGEPSESLQLALAARLRLLGAVAREAMGLLALAGRSLEREHLGKGGAELVEAGLATSSGGRLEARHALIAETCADQLAEAERRSLHTWLARLLTDPGEAARHHAAAGEGEQAFAKAMLAAERAERPGERAAHLGLAAVCAVGPEADELRLRAAAALTEAGEHDRAEALLADVELADPLLKADACLLRWRARTVAVDYPAARAALAEGLDLARGTGSDVEVRLAQAEVATVRLIDNDAARALPMAREALRLACSTGRFEARARSQLGTALLFTGAPGWEEEYSAALAAARREQDLETELIATNNLVLGYLLDGLLEESARRAEQALARSRELRVVATGERRFRAFLVELDWHRGFFRSALERGEAVLGEHLNVETRTMAEFFFGKALVAVGRYDDARRLALRMRESAPEYGPAAKGAAEESIEALWVLAEAELWSGRPRKALDALEACFATFVERDHPQGFAPLHLLRAWACVDLGREVSYPTLHWLPRLQEAAPTELEAVAALASGDVHEAATLFDRAAEMWSGRHFPAEVRCRWAAGEALRREAEEAAAIERLLAAELQALASEYVPLLARIRRSLRLAGVRPAAARPRGERRLTGREREVLELVGAGLSNVEIARRLGIGRPTVVGLIQSASRKLGARTRTQAAVLAAREWHAR